MSDSTVANVLNKHIDALGQAKTLPEAIAKMQMVLREMAYYICESEGALMETREVWHEVGTQSLKSAAGSADAENDENPALADRKTRETQPRIGRSAAPPRQNTAAAAPPATPRKKKPSAASTSAVPKSLMKILNGTHPSLGGDD